MNDTAPLPPHRDPATIAACDAALRELRELVPAFSSALLLSDDGFEIARVPVASAEGARLASMASALQALSEAISSELGHGATSYALIESAAGRVLLHRVPGHPVILAGVFDDLGTVGMAVSVSRRIVEDLSQQLVALRGATV